MKRAGFIMLFITICVMLNAQTGEEMLKRAISTNPTNSWSSNAKQKGQWTDGSNMGAYLYPDGAVYLGGFLGNENHGYGILIVPEGKIINNCPNAKYHVGNWSHEKKSGTGTCYDKSGTLIYYGEFKDDKPTGAYPTTGYSAYKFQTIDLTDGDKYIGETLNGKGHGYGVYAWKDGQIWIGNWKEGVRAGEGFKVAVNGDVVTGSWDDNTHNPAPTVASSSPSSGKKIPSGGTERNPGPTVASSSPGSSSSSVIDPNTGGYVTTTTPCFVCSGTGWIQGLNPMYGMGAADSIRYGYRNTTPMYTRQICYSCNGQGSITKTTYVPPSSSSPSSGSSSNYSSPSSSSGGTRTCDLCLGKKQLWEYTGSAGDNRTTIYCSVSGCDVKSPHRHITCTRCGGTGRLSL